MTDYQHWTLDIDQKIAEVTLSRPEKLNSLTTETLHELRDISNHLKDNKDVWVIILQSDNDNFSTGIDVNEIQNMIGQDETEYRESVRDLQNCLDSFEALPQPIIAEIRGYCIGGGLLLACCCDFRVADTTASFHLPEVQLGLTTMMGAQRLIQIAGISNTKEMVLMAERFNAEKAKSYGLLHNLVEPDELDEIVEDFAIRFSQLPPRTVQLTKQIINKGTTIPLRESQDMEIDAQASLLNTTDFAEGVSAFFEKRSPSFTGE